MFAICNMKINVRMNMTMQGKVRLRMEKIRKDMNRTRKQQKKMKRQKKRKGNRKELIESRNRTQGAQSDITGLGFTTVW
jgi:hypothetical protein